MDRKKYMENSLSILSTIKFAKIDHDPTACNEGKVQRTLRKIKNKPFFILKFTQQDHFPFYETAKLDKVPKNDTIVQLPL